MQHADKQKFCSDRGARELGERREERGERREREFREFRGDKEFREFNESDNHATIIKFPIFL